MRGAVGIAALCLALAFAWGVFCAPAAAKLKVVCEISDLGYFAKRIAGDLAEITVLCPGAINPHFLEARPSHVRATAEADLFLEIGLSCVPAAREIRKAAANPRLRVVVCSKGVKVRDVPRERIDPSQGHLHPFGNPHIWLSPRNAMIIVGNVLNAFRAVDRAHADVYTANARKLLQEIQQRTKDWQRRMAPFKGKTYVSYHQTYEYFADFFGVRRACTLEEKLGVPPSAAHVRHVIETVNANDTRLILQEVFYPGGAAKSVAADTKAKVIISPTSTGALGTKSWFDVIERLVRAFEEAYK